MFLPECKIEMVGCRGAAVCACPSVAEQHHVVQSCRHPLVAAPPRTLRWLTWKWRHVLRVTPRAVRGAQRSTEQRWPPGPNLTLRVMDFRARRGVGGEDNPVLIQLAAESFSSRSRDALSAGKCRPPGLAFGGVLLLHLNSARVQPGSRPRTLLWRSPWCCSSGQSPISPGRPVEQERQAEGRCQSSNTAQRLNSPFRVPSAFCCLNWLAQNVGLLEGSSGEVPAGSSRGAGPG